MSDIPGKTVTDFHDKNKNLSIPYSLVTIPMAGYVAKDKNGNVGKNEIAPSNRWNDIVFEKKDIFSLIPNVSDTHVYSDEFVHFLVNKYGKANTLTGIKWYSLDNEPALWTTTHPYLHPNKVTVSEIITKSIDLSKAIKSVDENAEIFWAVTYGFWENNNLQDAPDWSKYSTSYKTYIETFLAKLQVASTTYNKRLLDVLDIHWYPEARGVSTSGQKIRIIENNNDRDVAQARMQAPRSLWDPTYTEDSWIGQWFARTAFPLIPKLKSAIAEYYPGTKLAISEFDYGGSNHISGGIAMADVLGIYGKYGVYFASYWGEVNGYISTAYKLYRNVDGKNTTFGDTEISTTNPDIENTSIYASIEWTWGKVHIILINKKSDPIKTYINLNAITANTVDIYGFDSTSFNIKKITTLSILNNSINYTMPGLSVIHMILIWNTNSSVVAWIKSTTTSSNSLSIQNNPNKIILDKYILLLENALHWKTKEQQVFILKKVLWKLQGLQNRYVNWKQKNIIRELIDITLMRM